MHLAADIIGLVTSSVAFYFILAGRGLTRIKSRNRAILFLSLDIAVEVIEDLMRGRAKIMFTPEGIALEAMTLALTAMALYYVVSGKYAEEKVPFNVASWCMGWVIMGESLEFIMGFILGPGD